MELDQIDAPADGEDEIDYEKLDNALRKLQTIDPRRYRVVMLRDFAGLTEQQTAEALNMTAKTVQRDWNTAKVYLQSQMKQ